MITHQDGLTDAVRAHMDCVRGGRCGVLAAKGVIVSTGGSYFRQTGRAALGSIALLYAVVAADKAQAEEATSADAALDTPDGGAIVVTARRRNENAQDVPIALSVLGGKRLESTNVFTLDQAKQQIPSLQIFAINPRNTNINIRNLGSNASVSSDGLDSGVGVYVDDVYYARPGQSVFDLVDIDRIEVLKGPQGTLFGRNTTAGAVSITTRAPSFTPQATAEVSVGNYDYVQARASTSLPIIDDKVAIRLTASNTYRQGTVDNVRTGGKLLNLDSQTLRGQILIKPTDTFTLRVIADYSIRNENCCLGLPAGVVTTLPNGTPIANNFYQRAAWLGYTLPTLNAFDRITDINAASYYKVKQKGISANAQWSLGDVSLTSITAYRTWDWEPHNDTDATGLSVFNLSQTTTHQKQFSQELRLASTGTRTIDWVAGLYYFHQSLLTQALTEFGADAAGFALPPAVPAAIGSAALNAFRFVSDSRAKTDSYAVFGQANWHLSDRLTLTGGLRFTHEKKSGDFDQRQIGGVDLSTLPVAVAGAARGIRNNFGPANSYTARTTNSSLSGQATLAYKLSPDVLTYATYARGNKSGGLNIANLPSGVDPVVGPEKVDHYELGVKTTPLPGVTLNGAAFWTEIQDFQSTFSDAARSLTYLTNAAKVRSRGGEIDLQADPFKGAWFYASATYADTVYLSYRNAPCPFGVPGVGGTATCDLSGQSLPNAPRWAFAAGGEVARPMAGKEVYVGADWSYKSSFNSAADNSPVGRIDGYSLVNARAGIRLPGGQWDLYGWARNLLNKDYYTRLGVAPFNTGLLVASVGEPRTYGVTGRFRF